MFRSSGNAGRHEMVAQSQPVHRSPRGGSASRRTAKGLKNILFLVFSCPLTPVDQHGRALTHFPDGRKIPGSIVTVEGPYRSAAEEHGL